MSTAPDAPSDDRARVAAALAGLSAAVRQRQAERAATATTGADELTFQVAELRRREFVQEPAPVSPRPVLGRLVVFVRKAAYHLFFKWHARAVLQQQNEFNQAVSRLAQDLAANDRERRAELARLARRVEALEAERRSGPGAA